VPDIHHSFPLFCYFTTQTARLQYLFENFCAFFAFFIAKRYPIGEKDGAQPLGKKEKRTALFYRSANKIEKISKSARETLTIAPIYGIII